MATNAVVTYILNVKGGFKQEIDAATKALEKFGSQFGKTAKDLQRNQLLSDVEAMFSILTQMGGSLSQIGIIASTSVRPLYTLYKAFGDQAGAASASTAALVANTIAANAGAIAIGGLALGVTALAYGTIKAITATQDWIAEQTKLRSALVEQGYLTNNDARALLEYERALDRGVRASEKLNIEIADKLAPAFQELTDASTGAKRALSDFAGESTTSYGSISRLVQVLGGMSRSVPLLAAGLEFSGLAESGRQQDLKTRLAPDAVRMLTAPLAFGDGAPVDYKGISSSFVGPTQAQLAIGGEIVRQREKDEREAKQKRDKAESDLMEEISRALAMNEKEKDLIEQRVKAQIAINDNLLQGYYEGIEFQKETKEIIKRMEKETADFQRDYAASDKISMEGGLEGVVTSAAGGGAGILGPIGITLGLFNALVDELFNLPNMINGTLDNALRVFLDLPELVFDLAGLVVPRIIRAIPEMISGFILIAPAVVWEFVKAAPIIFSSIFEALFQLPEEFVRQLKDAFKFEELLNILRGFREMWGGLTPGGLLKEAFTGEQAARKEASFLGMKLPSFDTGGMVARTGLAQVHAGERVLNRQETRNYNNGVGVINIYGATDLRRLSEQVQRSTGRYGIGLSLNPYVGG